MLVLSRKSKESIVIGDQIVVEILEISNNKIRIGIAAPDHVRVVRGELTPKQAVHGRGAANGPDELGKANGDSANKQVPATPTSSEQGRASLTSGPLGKSRQRVAGGSNNPNVRTVSDMARHRLRQLRQQTTSEPLDSSSATSSESCDTNSTSARNNRTRRFQSGQQDSARYGSSQFEPAPCDLTELELTGREIAETVADYQVPTKRSQQEFSPRLRAAEDQLTTSEVYWQVAALNHYRNEWVAEEPMWFGTSELETSLVTADVCR